MNNIKEIRERHKLVQEVCPPSSGGLKSAGELAHNDRATLLKKVGELEAQVGEIARDRLNFLKRAESAEKQLDAVRLEHRKEYDRAEMETGRAKDAEAQLDAVRDAYPDLIGIEIALTAKLDAYCKASVMKVDYDKLKKQLDAVRSLEPKFADIAVNKTVKVLMYDDVQAALQGEKE